MHRPNPNPTETIIMFFRCSDILSDQVHVWTDIGRSEIFCSLHSQIKHSTSFLFSTSLAKNVPCRLLCILVVSAILCLSTDGSGVLRLSILSQQG